MRIPLEIENGGLTMERLKEIEEQLNKPTWELWEFIQALSRYNEFVLDIAEDAKYLFDQLQTANKQAEEAEKAIDDMTKIIQQNGYARCEYCVFKGVPCVVRDNHLNANCSFEYCGKEKAEKGAAND